MKTTTIVFLFLISILGSTFSLAQKSAEYYEREGLEPELAEKSANQKPGARKLKGIPSGGVLLIPDSGDDRVMAFDPQTGDLLDENFIPMSPNLSTPIEVALHPDGNSLLVSDQLQDAVIQFDLDGNFIGVFAPAGGTVVNNLRGLEVHPVTGHILVSSGEGMILEFDQSGNYVGDFIPDGTGGMTDPFDIAYRPSENDFIVAGIDNDAVFQYDIDGNFISVLVPFGSVNFPEQVSTIPNNNILVSTFSSPDGLYEYMSDGTYVGYYDIYGNLRGNYELPNQNLLVTNNSGVYEIDRNNTLISTKISGPNCRFIAFIESGPSTIVDVKVFLEGPYNGMDMETQLVGLPEFPLAQPYNVAPWNYNGTENVASAPTDDIVDWVLIELRETTGDVTTATSDSIVGQQAAFLLSDGSIVGMDGSSPLEFEIEIIDNLFIVVYHRNHIGVISASPVSQTGGNYTYDFSTGANQANGGINGHKDIGGGVFGMASGDGNADGQVGNADKNVVWSLQAGQGGYLSGDFNLDGQSENVDKNIYWNPNGGFGVQVPDNVLIEKNKGYQSWIPE